MDANIVIAAFLRDSTVRRIVTLSVLELLAPEFLRVELEDHMPQLRRRAGLSEAAASEVIERLQKYVDFLPAEAILPHWEAAAVTNIFPRMSGSLRSVGSTSRMTWYWVKGPNTVAIWRWPNAS